MRTTTMHLHEKFKGPYPPMRRTAATVFLITFGVLSITSPAEAQQRPPSGPGAAQGWAPIQIGAAVGFDNNSRGTITGAYLRIPVLPSGAAELIPGGDITFHSRGLKDYEFTLDGVYVVGGPGGGLYGGGGLAMRSSIWDESGVRETKSGPTAVLGLKTQAVGGGPVGIQIQVRWMWVDEDIRPQTMTFGLNFPLWGRGRR